MRHCVIVIILGLFCSGIAQAQTTDCTVVGYLFNANGSPAAQAQVKVISVVNNGSSFVLTPIVLTTDAIGFTSFTVPRLSIVWISATALGLTGPGDVAILIPAGDSATLDVLAQSARPPISAFNLTSGFQPSPGALVAGFRDQPERRSLAASVIEHSRHSCRLSESNVLPR